MKRPRVVVCPKCEECLVDGNCGCSDWTSPPSFLNEFVGWLCVAAVVVIAGGLVVGLWRAFL